MDRGEVGSRGYHSGGGIFTVGDYGGGGQGWRTPIHGFRVYSEALTPDEVSGLPSIVAYDGTGATAPTATISGLTGGTAYSYIVESLSGSGVGAVSAVATQSTSPATPLDLSSTLQTSTSISLSWSASVAQTNGAAVTNYRG